MDRGWRRSSDRRRNLAKGLLGEPDIAYAALWISNGWRELFCRAHFNPEAERFRPRPATKSPARSPHARGFFVSLIWNAFLGKLFESAQPRALLSYPSGALGCQPRAAPTRVPARPRVAVITLHLFKGGAYLRLMSRM